MIEANIITVYFMTKKTTFNLSMSSRTIAETQCTTNRNLYRTQGLDFSKEYIKGSINIDDAVMEMVHPDDHEIHREMTLLAVKLYKKMKCI